MWTPPATGLATIDLSGPDPLLQVRGDCADPNTELACNDDAGGDTLDSQVTVFAVAGAPMFVIAEIFTLAMRELPNVTVVGQPTSGELSDILSRTLHNGWSLGLSNEQYLAADGTLFEAVGIPAETAIEADLLQQDAWAGGTDPWLEAALDALP